MNISSKKKLYFRSILVLILLFVLNLKPIVVQAGLPVGYSPSQIKSAYNLSNTGGDGVIVGIISPAYSNIENDLATFSSQFNLPPCTQSNGCLTIHNIGIGSNEASCIGETSMDVEWVHAIAPNAKILLIGIACSGGHLGDDMSTAIQYAEQQNIDILSMSFGSPERAATDQACSSLFSNANITSFASSGDWGSGIYWPAVCPQVIGVGGTTLIANGSSSSETAWSGSGGGLSQLISDPSYQANFNIQNTNGNRAVPDISAVADPHYGAVVVVQGQNQVIGGTSLSAPIWAGIAALNGGHITHESLYTNASPETYPNYFRDITQGANGSCGEICNAGIGYDFVTGLGSPIALPGSKGSNGGPSGGTTITPTITQGPTSSQQSNQIKGEAFNDTNGNSTLDAGETAFAGGVDIIITGAKNLTATTDSSGSYSFADVPVGSYTMNAKISGNAIVLPLPFQILAGSNTTVHIDIPVNPNQLVNPTPVVIAPTIITPTPTTTPPDSGGGGGDGGGNGGFVKGTPTPTPDQYFNCKPDPNCAKNGKSIQLCPLICTPQ